MKDLLGARLDSFDSDWDFLEDEDFDTMYEDALLRQWSGLATIVDDAAADEEEHDLGTVINV